jgi:rhodanese-related sulfurtransferase
MKLGYLLVAVTVFLGAFLIYQAYLYATDSPYRISASDAKQRIKDGQVDLILDVRTDVERATMGFYPGSVPIPSADLEAKMPAAYPDKQVRILAYCNTGHRARLATDKLHALGYTNAVFISSTYGSLL